MGRTYISPDVDAPAVRALQQSNELTPETPVKVIFRGGPPVHDMWDSKDYTVPPVAEGFTLDEWRAQTHPPSFWTLPYEVATHLQARAIVPGTRNPHDFKKAVSQIGIPNIDREDRCTPFTLADLKKFGYREGIDRTQFADGRRDVTFVDTADALKNTLVDTEQILDAPPDADTIAPPSDHEGLRDVRGAEQDSGVQGASRTRRGKARFDDEK
jgi:hypothetical protein